MKHFWALLFLVCCVPVFATDLTLKWSAPAKNTDGTTISGPITYTVYGANQGSPLVLLTSGITTLTNVRTNVNPGTICYAVSATVASVESAQTPPVCTTVSPPVPGSPGGLTVTLATTSTIAYGLAPSHDRIVFLVVGSVPLGTACLPDQYANLYHVVPSANVTYTAPYKATTVPTAFALCGA